jgi:hypothetical protein
MSRFASTSSRDPARPNVLWTASEVRSTDDRARWVRFIAIDINNKTTLEQYVYEKESDAGNGVVSIITLDYDGTFLVMSLMATIILQIIWLGCTLPSATIPLTSKATLDGTE